MFVDSVSACSDFMPLYQCYYCSILQLKVSAVIWQDAFFM